MRALIEALVQFDPTSISSAPARIYQTTHPSATERDRARWETEVTGRLNKSPIIMASGDITPSSVLQSLGIGAMTDNGIGDRNVHFDEVANDAHYHVSLELPLGYGNILDKTAAGFKVRTLHNGEAIDTDISFRVIR